MGLLTKHILDIEKQCVMCSCYYELEDIHTILGMDICVDCAKESSSKELISMFDFDGKELKRFETYLNKLL